MSFRWSPLLFLAWAVLAFAGNVDKSDLNDDGVVDDLDLAIFAGLYFEEDPETIDWCAFYESSMVNPKYFRDIVSDQPSNYTHLLDYIALTYQCNVVEVTDDKSDLDGDGDVDFDDLVIFSTNYLEKPWDLVDWCVFHGSVVSGADYEGKSTRYYQQHFTLLLEFINDHFGCNTPQPPPGNLVLENSPRFLARIADAIAINGNYYVSDPRVGSVFIYNELMALEGELKGLNKPLGVAVDSQGRILVGNDGRNNIEVFDSVTGETLAVFGTGIVQMPTAITIDSGGFIYVTDSKLNHVQVFDSTFNPVRTIGRAGAGEDTLTFPMDTAIIDVNGVPEVFVADQGGYRVQVFDLNGNWLRSITFAGTDGQNCNWFTGVCEIPGMPPFTKVQALASDSLGRLHVLDSFAASAMIFDPVDGTFVNAYGGYGDTAGLLRLPMDLSVSSADMAIVTAGDGSRVEIFNVPQ